VSNGDDFYHKLIELRNEQKKSLQFMEDLYNQKHQLKEELIRNEPALLKNGGAVAYLTPQAVAESYKFNLNSMSAYEPPSSVNHLTQSALAAHNLQSSHNSQSSILNTNVTSGRHSAIRVNTSKPPLPTKVNSTVTFQDSVTVNNITRDEDDYEGSMLSGGERRGLYDTIQSDMRHIERIWSDFKFEDSKSVDFNRKFERRVVKKSPANRAGARRSESLKRRPASASLEWIPRVTVPEPFSMTLREGVKNEKTLKAFQETREEREARAEAELRECKRQFKANPAPAHITLPLYEKIKMEEELRKMRLKKASQEYMERVARPFNLTEPKRGGSVKERRHSFTEGDQQDTAFYAQPLPEYYFNEDLTQEKLVFFLHFCNLRTSQVN
jgi:protein FAM161A